MQKKLRFLPISDGFQIAMLISQIPDLNRVPARYEGAALPGELIWQI